MDVTWDELIEKWTAALYRKNFAGLDIEDLTEEEMEYLWKVCEKKVKSILN